MKMNLKSMTRQHACIILLAASGMMFLQAAAAQTLYIGDDAAEGAAITAGGVNGDSVAILTYDFVQNNGSIYTNTSAVAQTITLTQVNFYAGPNSGKLTPFVSIYSGGQAASAVAVGANYSVISVGDAINVTNGAGLQNQQFTVSGTNPAVALPPGAILTAGMQTTTNFIVELNNVASGLIDYIANGNTLPAKLGGALTNNSNYTLDRTLKFNVGFTVAGAGVGTIATTAALSTSTNSSAYVSNVTFTATITPAPTNGEQVVFYNGATTLGTAPITNGQATFSTSTLPVGTNSISVYYGGDGLYMASTSPNLQQTVYLILPTGNFSYIGDDAAEGSAITSGNSAGDTATSITYDFVQNNGSIYINTNAYTESVKLVLVNFYSGAGSGIVRPFASIYTGLQTSAAVGTASNYTVVAVGDPIAVTANSGLINQIFTAGGLTPTIFLPPGAVLTAGFYMNLPQVVQLNTGGSGLIDYIASGNALPATVPNRLTAASAYTLDRTIKFNVGIAISPVYIGDDASEGNAITPGNSAGDSGSALTYDFVQNNGSIYTNTNSFAETVALSQVDFYAGSGSGAITPIVATYTGAQTPSAVGAASNYTVLSIGDPITVTANSGLQNQPFTVGGAATAITLAPGAVLTAGFLTSNSNLVELTTTGTGLVDYVFSGDSLPASPGKPFTGDSASSLDRVVKFNISVVPYRFGSNTTTTLASSSNPSTNGSPMTLTATVSPAPPNGETITFYNGASILATGLTANGQATFTTNVLPVGTLTLSASYPGDANLLPSSSSLLASTLLTQTVFPLPSASTVYYIGDDAAQGLLLTIGNQAGDTATSLTYDFAQNNGSIYTNTTAVAQTIQLVQVNLYAGSASGIVIPFVSLYSGTQTAGDVANGGNYTVISIGDSISVTANSGLQNLAYTVNGKSPTVSVPPGAVLTAGFYMNLPGVVYLSTAGTGLNDYIAHTDSLPTTVPATLTASSAYSLDRTIKFNIGFTFPAQYIGDDAAEGKGITAGNSTGDTVAVLTYDFVQNNGSTYTNTNSFVQSIQLTQVNFYAGSKSGAITPFIATYSGAQTAAAVGAASNYIVLSVGDPITVTANSALQNQSYTVGGLNPTITLAPGAVMSAGFLTSAASLVQLSTTASGLIDYIRNGNALPATVPNALTAASSFSLDRTIKFNIGFLSSRFGTNSVTTLGSSADPSVNGTPVTLTAAISPAPANGETVTFYNGTNVLGTALTANGQATFATNSLLVGFLTLTASYPGDINLLPSSSSPLSQTVYPPFLGTYYIGDDAIEAAAVTPGNSEGDTATNVTYAFVESIPAIYYSACWTNNSGNQQKLELTQVNFFTGAPAPGAKVIPFVAIYYGSQVFADVSSAGNYNVLVIGDPVAVSATNALINAQFTTNGVNPILTTSPGDVLCAGFVTVGSATVVQLNNMAVGVPDYVYVGNSLPATVPLSGFTVNSTLNLDRTLKFNVGFGLGNVVTATTISSPTPNPSSFGASVVFTATVTPAPANGQTVAFEDGGALLVTASITNGTAVFSTGALGIGAHSITANYVGDGNNFPSTSAPLARVVSPGSTVPGQILFQASGGQFQVSWPADHTGWRLQMQADTANTGITANWVTVPNSTLTNQETFSINPTNDVFFRLVYP